MALRDEVKKQTQVEMIPEQPPKYDSRTSGRGENAVQRIEGQFRTLRDALETRIKGRIEPGHPVVEWMVMHAADTLNRYHVGSDGKTAYQRWKGKAFKKTVPELGENVVYLRSDSLKEIKRDKGRTRWSEGHFLGIRNETGELLIGNEEGVVSARDFQRIADPSRRWSAESLKALKGLPWQPNPRVTDGEVHPSLRIPEASGELTPEFKGVEEEPTLRRMRITPRLVKQVGLSSNCNGCRAIRDNAPPQNHSEECRRKVEKWLEDNGKGDRVNNAYARIVRQFEKKHEEARSQGQLKRDREENEDQQIKAKPAKLKKRMVAWNRRKEKRSMRMEKEIQE